MQVFNIPGEPVRVSGVFYVEGGSSVKPIAFDIQIDPNLAWWQDASHKGHSVPIKSYKITKESGAIDFETESGEKYHLQLLTRKIYEEKVKPKINPVKVDFKSDAEVQAYFLKTSFPFS